MIYRFEKPEGKFIFSILSVSREGRRKRRE